jgi:mono/diheme cytochrome c family protein
MAARGIVGVALAGLVLAGCGGGSEVTDPGAQVFEAQGCGGCHTLEAADSSGAVGPDLDEALARQAPASIRESIVDPAARIASGFPDIMPKVYGEQLTDRQLQQLVAFLAGSTGG